MSTRPGPCHLIYLELGHVDILLQHTNSYRNHFDNLEALVLPLNFPLINYSLPGFIWVTLRDGLG